MTSLAAVPSRPVPSTSRLGVRPALALSGLAGFLLAGQARVNGSLAEQLGAAVPAALVSFAVGTAVVAGFVLASPGSRRAAMTRPGGPVRWWYVLGGLAGAALVTVSAQAVPVIGVALLGVGIVTGQTVGALLVDRAGLGPGGRRTLTPGRLLGAALAVVAVLVATAGSEAGAARPLLLGVVALAGAGVAVQQAANGHLQRITGEASVAALVSFAGGVLTLAVVMVVLTASGGLPPVEWGLPEHWPLYIGGMGGAVYVTVGAATVRLLGVLRLSLATVAGQMVGSVAIDALAPADGTRLTSSTVVGAALTLVAVSVAGRPGSPLGWGRR